MQKVKTKRTLKILLPLFILAVFVFLAPEARAIFGLDYLTEGALNFAVLFIQGLIMGFIGTALAWTAYALAWFLKFQGGFFENVTIVQTSWAIFRDFANMFFILILIIIAFATIFDWQNYNWKGLMAKFIIAALLINFSLAIGGFLIGISTNLSNIMLKQFGDITSNLAGGLGITKIADIMTSPHGNLGTSLMSTIISVSGTIIIASVALLAMFSALVFSIVRVPVLWALLIVSPIAWITGILPATRTFNQKWWNLFIGWTFFLPMYLFALMMGFVILKNRPDLGAAALLAQEEGFATTAGNIFGFAFQDIFYYTLTLIILIGGLATSLKASFAAGNGATKVFGNISGTINNWAKRKTGITGAQELFKRVKQEGLPEQYGLLGKLYTGTRGAQKETAAWEQKLARKLGYTPETKLQQQQVGEIDAEVSRLKNLELAGELTVDSTFQANTLKEDRNSIKGMAARGLLYERGLIDATEFDKDMTDWTKRNAFVAQSMSSRAAKGGYKKVPTSQLVQMAKAEGPTYLKYKTPSAISSRKEWYKFIQSDEKALSDSEFDNLAFENGLELFGGNETIDGGNYIKAINKVRPDLVASYKMTLPPRPGVAPMRRDQYIEKSLTNPIEISKMPMTVWSDPDFRTALTNKLVNFTSPKARNTFKNRLRQAVRDNNSTADAAAKELIIT